MILKFSQNLQENTCAESIFDKAADLMEAFYENKLHQTCNVNEKETPAQKFFQKFCEIFKNTYFVEHLRTAASVRNDLLIHCVN